MSECPLLITQRVAVIPPRHDLLHVVFLSFKGNFVRNYKPVLLQQVSQKSQLEMLNPFRFQKLHHFTKELKHFPCFYQVLFQQLNTNTEKYTLLISFRKH